jgi:PKHD-type hydroxylase
MNQLWQMWSGVLNDPTVTEIITECEYYAPQNANLGFDGNSQVNNYRNSEIRWINKSDQNSKFIAELLWYYAEEANRNAFGFDITSIKEIQYTIYNAEENGKYDWHFDTFWANPTTFDRKISLIVQLSDSNDYEGGDFEIDHQYPQPPNLRKKGTVFAFPSFLLHRVTPVTKGIRKSLVTWIEGPKFK